MLNAFHNVEMYKQMNVKITIRTIIIVSFYQYYIRVRTHIDAIFTFDQVVSEKDLDVIMYPSLKFSEGISSMVNQGKQDNGHS